MCDNEIVTVEEMEVDGGPTELCYFVKCICVILCVNRIMYPNFEGP